jgi:hypothetical protein
LPLIKALLATFHLDKKTTRRWFLHILVARGGIEPPTQGFSILLPT